MKGIVFILFLTCAYLKPFEGQAQVNIITTIVNVDTGYGYNGDNIPATTAELYFPEAVCFDKSGNLLIADVANNRIRKVDESTGIITTIAGRDTDGYSGDNGLAINAGLFFPTDVFVDTTGNIFIADALDNRIRKISLSTGIITTIAGSGVSGYSGDNELAINAELNTPSGLFVDKTGDVFIADYSNNVVRKINSSTGIITTFAGTGIAGFSGDNGLAIHAKFNGPQKVCCDDSGNVYISDQWNSVVRKVNGATGIITTFAGNGTAGYTGDSGLAKNAKLNRPAGLFLDSLNNLFVTEFGNGIVRRIDGATRIISTVAGTGTWGYSGDGGPATSAKMIPADAIFDTHGNMVIADYNNQCIRKVNNALGISSVIIPKQEVTVYPNPARDELIISSPDKITNISVCNPIGQIVYSQEYNAIQVTVNINNLPAGIYLVKINGIEVKRFVKE